MADTSKTSPPTTQPAIDSRIDYYRLLGVDANASLDEIRRGYRAAMKRTHPDRASADNRTSAESEAREVNHAFRILSNPQYRQQYDASRKNEAIQQQIMSRYAGGFGAPGGEDDLMARIRDAAMADQRKRQRQSDRTATASLLLAFAVLLVAIVVFILIWGISTSIF